ncbi:MAG: CoB--CoM heterodisulfide reductase iron-sulfur subunit B family protein [Candidatus Latescibacteria bacterium]|nr:CoB--CoM heterodisulfide reductase iron-sulfur subunit B family protein [Candidatus Latescibacterota bacterium]
MKYAYFPGCSAHSTARDSHMSTLAVAHALDIEMVEPIGWSCCGATAAHQTGRVLAAALPAANLVLAQHMGMDMVATCAACYNRLKIANFEISHSPEMREHVSDAIGRDYDGSVRVIHFVELLIKDIGLKSIRSKLKKSLDNLKVACFYGCLLVRPHDVMQFDDPENPTSLDNLVNMMGGESLDWPHKVECCGGGLSLTRTDVVIRLTDSILAMAQESGAECIAVACPMCQSNLDMRQKDITKATGRKYNMPIIYTTQLLGLCLGLSPKELGLEKLIVPADKIIEVIEGK